MHESAGVITTLPTDFEMRDSGTGYDGTDSQASDEGPLRSWPDRADLQQQAHRDKDLANPRASQSPCADPKSLPEAAAASDRTPLCCRIIELQHSDWAAVAEIYQEGIDLGYATMEMAVPTWENWDRVHRDDCRFIALNDAGRIRSARRFVTRTILFLSTS